MDNIRMQKYLGDLGCPKKVSEAEDKKAKLVWLVGQAVKLEFLKDSELTCF